MTDVLSRQPATTGWLVHNESVLPAVVAVLQELGRTVPDDASVVAICPDDMADTHAVAFTNIGLPAEDLGEIAVEMALRHLDGRDRGRDPAAVPRPHRAREHAAAAAVTDVRVGLCGWTIAQRAYVDALPGGRGAADVLRPARRCTAERAGGPACPRTSSSPSRPGSWSRTSRAARPTAGSRPRCRTQDRGSVGAFRSTPPVLRAWARTLRVRGPAAGDRRAAAVPEELPADGGQRRSGCAPSSSSSNAGRRAPAVGAAWRLAVAAGQRAVPRPAAGPRHRPDAVADTVTPEQTYFRLHGTTGLRHVHTDDELRRLRDLVAGRPSPYVMFNNLERARTPSGSSPCCDPASEARVTSLAAVRLPGTGYWRAMASETRGTVRPRPARERRGRGGEGGRRCW